MGVRHLKRFSYCISRRWWRMMAVRGRDLGHGGAFGRADGFGAMSGDLLGTSLRCSFIQP